MTLTPPILAALLLLIGIVLLLGELLLPTHGVLGILGMISFAGMLGVCFYINQWMGLVIFLASVVASPFLLEWSVSIWEKTPVGKKFVLPAVEAQVFSTQVKLGEEGVAVSELRPMGECEFGEHRVEVLSEYGMIPSGRRVRVVGMTNGRPTVREIQSESPAA